MRTYEIGLETVDDQGAISRQAEVRDRRRGPGPPNRPPEASFVFFPAGPVAGELITFVSTSTDAGLPDSTHPALNWDLNGGRRLRRRRGAELRRRPITVAGTYTISLRIATNKTDVATLVLNVGAPGVPGRCRAAGALADEPVPGGADRRAGLAAAASGSADSRSTHHPAPAVKVRCGGRGCPFKRLRRTISLRVSAPNREPAAHDGCCGSAPWRAALLRPGVKLRLFVTRPGCDREIHAIPRFAGASRPPAPTCAWFPGASARFPCPSR